MATTGRNGRGKRSSERKGKRGSGSEWERVGPQREGPCSAEPEKAAAKTAAWQQVGENAHTSPYVLPFPAQGGPNVKVSPTQQTPSRPCPPPFFGLTSPILRALNVSLDLSQQMPVGYWAKVQDVQNGVLHCCIVFSLRGGRRQQLPVQVQPSAG